MAFRTLSQEEIVGLPPEQAQALQPPQPSGFRPLPSEFALRGSVGMEVPREASVEISETRQRAREPIGTGVFPQEDQLAAAIARGLLSGVTAELSEAGLEKAIQKDTFDPNSPQFTNPSAYGFSELIGSVLSPGKIIKGALKVPKLLTGAVQAGKQIVKSAPSLAKSGALYGAGYGAAGGEAGALREDLGLQESIQETLEGAAKGATVGAVTGGLISKAQALRMNPSETFLAFVKPRQKSKAENEAFSFIDQGKLEQAVGSVKNFFKLPKKLTVEQAKDLSYATADNLYGQVDDIINQFPTHQLLGSRLKDGIQREVLDSPLINALSPSAKKELTDFADKISVDRPLGEAIQLQKQLNAKLKTYIASIKAGGDPKLDDQIQVLNTLRRHNSNLIDDAITGLTGTTDNPYRRWGSVNELGDILYSRYKNLTNLRAQEKAGGFLGAVGKARGPISIVSGPYNYVVGGEMRNADTLVSSLFNKIPEYQITPLLPRVAAQRTGRSLITPSQRSASQQLQRQASEEAAARAERQAMEATPEELQQYQSEIYRQQRTVEELKGFPQLLEKEYDKIQKAEIRSLKSVDIGNILSTFYHTINTTNDPTVLARLRNELQRRMDLKKYAKDLPEIRDALGIPAPTQGLNLPRSRELEVSEAVKQSLQEAP